MCETSNIPALVRTATCSCRIPSYWTGISQPAKGTSRAPAASCRSNRGVRRRVSAVDGKRPRGYPLGRSALTAGLSCFAPVVSVRSRTVARGPPTLRDPAGEVVRRDPQACIEVEPVGVRALRADSRVEVQLVAAEAMRLLEAPVEQGSAVAAAARIREGREVVDVEAVAPGEVSDQ